MLRQWVERFGGGNATTADFEALVEDVTGEPHADLFGAWLRELPLPQLHR